MSPSVQDGLLSVARAVQRLGPWAGRPHVDTLVGSRHSNMKELRFKAHDGREEWRAAFAFDTDRNAVVLVAGAKHGVSEARFYRTLIAKADRRFDDHLARLRNESRGTSRRP